MEFSNIVKIEGSQQIHNLDHLKTFGKIPVLSAFAGVYHLITAVALIALNAVALAVNTLIAIGDVLLVHSRDQAAVLRMTSNLGAITYNLIEIFHGTLDIVPVIGNIPYWAEGVCEREADEPVVSTLVQKSIIDHKAFDEGGKVPFYST